MQMCINHYLLIIGFVICLYILTYYIVYSLHIVTATNGEMCTAIRFLIVANFRIDDADVKALLRL